MAVRNILACRVTQKDRGFSEISMNSKAKYEAILKFVDKAMEDVFLTLVFFCLSKIVF